MDTTTYSGYSQKVAKQTAMCQILTVFGSSCSIKQESKII